VNVNFPFVLLNPQFLRDMIEQCLFMFRVDPRGDS